MGSRHHAAVILADIEGAEAGVPVTKNYAKKLVCFSTTNLVRGPAERGEETVEVWFVHLSSSRPINWRG